MSPIFIPRAPAERPQLLSGVTTGLQTLMPWERLDNPVLDKFMLPGSEEFSPNALKERAKVNVSATTFAPSGQEGGGGGGSGGKSGGGGVSYMPGGSPIGKGLPKAWSAPQGNFEAAKAKGELTPEKVKQAQDFAAAHGRTFDPTLGYSTNTRPAAQAPQQSQTGTPASPSTTPQVGVPAVPPKPGGNAPAPGGGDGFAHVFDGGKPVLTQAAKDKGITGWDENGAPIYGFADGTPPGGMPLRALEGRTFWTGERGPELQQIKDGKLTVMPTAGVQTMEDRQSWSPVFAPSADRVVDTPATPQTAFSTQSTEQGFTPAFSPTFAPTLSAPPGVRKTDFRRFLRTPQGMQFALGREAQSQGMAQHSQSRTAAMNTERQWQMDDKNAAKQDKNAAKQDKAAQEAAEEAGIDSIIKSMTGNETTLDPMWRDIVGSAKGAKAKQAALDLAIRHAMAKDAEAKQAEREQGDSVTGVEIMTAPDGSGYVPVTRTKAGGVQRAGGFMPARQTAAPEAPRTAKGSDGKTYQWTGQDWAPMGGEPAAKPAKMRYLDQSTGRITELDPQDDVSGFTFNEVGADGKAVTKPRFVPLRKAASAASSQGSAQPAKAGWRDWLKANK